MKIFKYIFILLVIFYASAAAADQNTHPPVKITLDDAIRLTLTNNPQIKASAMDILSSKGSYGISRSNLLPQINAAADWQRATSNFAVTSKNPFIKGFYRSPGNTSYPYYGLSVSIKQQIFGFGKNYYGMKSSEELVKAAGYNLINTKNALIYSVKQNFFNVLQYRMIIKSDKHLLEQMKIQLRQAEAYYKTGIKSKIDVLSAKTSLGNIRLNLITAENAERIYMLNLLSLMGMSLTSNVSFTGELSSEPFFVDTHAAIKQAIKNRPDYIALKRQFDADIFSYRQSWSAFFPTLSGTASYNWSGQNFPLVWNWTVGFELGFNLFSGLQTVSAKDIALSQMLKIKYTLEQRKRTIELDVESAINNIKQAEKSIAVAKDTLKQAKANLKLAEKSYKVGTVDYFEYISAAATYQNTQASYATALSNYNTAMANFEYVTGKGVNNED